MIHNWLRERTLFYLGDDIQDNDFDSHGLSIPLTLSRLNNNCFTPELIERPYEDTDRSTARDQYVIPVIDIIHTWGGGG